MNDSKIIASQLLCKGWGTLTEYVFQFSAADGSPVEITREVYDRGNAVAVLLHDRHLDNVILVKQFRPPPMVNGQNPFLLEVCAGLLDGMTPEASARREAMEETGVYIKNLRLVASAYGNPAALTEIVTMYIGEYESALRAAGGGLANEGEHIEVVELPFSQAYEKISSGEIVDMKTIVLLQAMKIERMARAVV